MAGWAGPWLVLRLHWGLRNERRYPSPFAGALVRRLITLDSQVGAQMKKAAALSPTQAGFFPEVLPHDTNDQPAKFHGTDNPRELRALDFLLRRPSMPREVFDREVGCANGPDLIRRLREYGLGKTHLPCTRIEVIDRDGCIARPGIYWLTPQGRRAVLQWLAQRGKGRME
jgi:hypothetical protein